MTAYPLLKVEDPTGLTDADWEEISKLQRAYSSGGTESLADALDRLTTCDPDRAAKVLDALTPREPTAVPHDELEGGELEELIRQLEVLAGEYARST
jgi:hypothetical protein